MAYSRIGQIGAEEMLPAPGLRGGGEWTHLLTGRGPATGADKEDAPAIPGEFPEALPHCSDGRI